MSLEEYLNPGEQIVWEHRMSSTMRLVVLAMFVVGGLLILTVVVGLIGIIMIAVAVSIMRQAGRDYAVTNQRVLSLFSLLSRSVKELPLEQVITIEVRESLTRRVFGCGDLIFNAAQASTGLEVSQFRIGYIRNPHQLRRLILEQRELLVQARLGMAASLATAATEEMRRESAVPPPMPVAEPPPLPAAEVPLWYYGRDGERHGPVSASELQRLARSGSLARQDLVWKAGMDNWAPAATVDGLF